MDWTQKTVLVTGGTGSFGRAFTRVLLDELHPAKIIVFSRDELKQHEMRVGGFDDPSLRYFIGDIRDRDRLRRAFAEVDIVVHAAAMKQVAACEYNPIEAIMTNVLGTRNVIDAALDTGVERALFIGTDKAVSPTNLYGATKLCGEKLFVESNAYSGASGTRFSCSRYGNVVGSRGSVIPLFKQQRETGTITVTDPRMTRFWITLEQGVRFVIHCVEEMHGGEVFVPKLPSMGLRDLADAIAPGCPIEEVGIRAGEKLHEVLVSEDEARHTLEFDELFVIWPTHSWWHGDRWSSGRPLPDGYSFTSDDNERWLSVDELRALAGS
jgi:UDP-N-acetylglucosamine 4,6-dehydratase/5-epimerase